MGVYYFCGCRPEVGPEALVNGGPWQDLKPEQQGHLRHDEMLGVRTAVRSPGGGARGGPADTSVI
jgi:hypothetical protein